jgi:membrane-bound ClpP family serine protease
MHECADWLAIAVMLAFAALGAATAAKAAPTAAPAQAGNAVRKTSPYIPAKATDRALEYYAAGGGVDAPRVQLTASGNLVRFSYRIVDAAAAKALVDRNATPYLYAPRAHALLHVPVMEQIGPLRQTGEIEVGKAYWMVFSNKGNLVKAGDRVSVIVGTYHIDGLMVE